MSPGAAASRPGGVLAVLWLLAATPSCPAQQESLDGRSDDDWFKITNSTLRVIDGCFYEDRSYAPILPSAEDDGCYPGNSTTACQLLCQEDPACKFFNLLTATGRCCLAGDDAYFQGVVPGSIAGPKTCDGLLGCREKPSSAFPGATTRDSLLAWPSHRMPEKLECWPRNWEGGVLSACDKITVLEDSEHGFPGRCTGLHRVPVVPQMESCESMCRKTSFCTIFQVIQQDPPYGPRSCWHGYAVTGEDCYMNRQSFKPIRAKRFMQGTVRVIANTTDYQIMGLKNAFKPFYFINASNAVRACRDQCYSSILCQYWQYLSHTGCWLEEPALMPPLQFPPTYEVWHNYTKTNLAKFILAGEYIQHQCEAVRGTVQHLLTTTTTTAPYTGEVYIGSLEVIGLAYENLTTPERDALKVLYAKDVAWAGGVQPSSVKDLSGTPGSVTLGADSPTVSPETQASEILPRVLVQYTVELWNHSRNRATRAKSALTSAAFSALVTNGTSTLLTDMRLSAAEQDPREAVVVQDVPAIRVESQEVHQDIHSPLPWYCIQILLCMIAALAVAGVAGWTWAKVMQGEESDAESPRPPQGHSGTFSPASAGKGHGRGFANGAGAGGQPASGCGAGTGACGSVAYGTGAGAGASGGVAYGAGGRSLGSGPVAGVPQPAAHSGGLRVVARNVVASAQAGVQRMEQAAVGLMPAQAGYDQLQPQQQGPSRNQLLQYAHQGR